MGEKVGRTVSKGSLLDAISLLFERDDAGMRFWISDDNIAAMASSRESEAVRRFLAVATATAIDDSDDDDEPFRCECGNEAQAHCLHCPSGLCAACILGHACESYEVVGMMCVSGCGCLPLYRRCDHEVPSVRPQP